MKKLSLCLDSLSVETFEPVAARTAQRGTVRGNEIDTEGCENVGFDSNSYDMMCSNGCTGAQCTVVATLPPACV
jgi:hypothetical protein